MFSDFMVSKNGLEKDVSQFSWKIVRSSCERKHCKRTVELSFEKFEPSDVRIKARNHFLKVMHWVQKVDWFKAKWHVWGKNYMLRNVGVILGLLKKRQTKMKIVCLFVFTADWFQLSNDCYNFDFLLNRQKSGRNAILTLAHNALVFFEDP